MLEHFRDELIGHIAHHDGPAGGSAPLARGAEGTLGTSTGRQVDVRVGEDHDGVLSAELTLNRLVKLTAARLDDPTHLGGTGKADDRHIGMIDDGRSGLYISMNDVHNTGRNASLCDELADEVV